MHVNIASATAVACSFHWPNLFSLGSGEVTDIASFLLITEQ